MWVTKDEHILKKVCCGPIKVTKNEHFLKQRNAETISKKSNLLTVIRPEDPPRQGLTKGQVWVSDSDDDGEDGACSCGGYWHWWNQGEMMQWGVASDHYLDNLILMIKLFFKNVIQFATSSRRLDGGAYCGAPVGGKCMVSKAKLVLYAFAV